MDMNFIIECSWHLLLLQIDNSIQADKFASIGQHVSSFLLKSYLLKIWIKYNFLNRSIEYRDPLPRNSARRKTNSISDIVIQKFLITRTISFKKELNSASSKKKKIEKKNKKTAHRESNTIMLINTILMTTLIPLCVKI